MGLGKRKPVKYSFCRASPNPRSTARPKPSVDDVRARQCQIARLTSCKPKDSVQ